MYISHNPGGVDNPVYVKDLPANHGARRFLAEVLYLCDKYGFALDVPDGIGLKLYLDFPEARQLLWDNLAIGEQEVIAHDPN